MLKKADIFVDVPVFGNHIAKQLEKLFKTLFSLERTYIAPYHDICVTNIKGID